MQRSLTPAMCRAARALCAKTQDDLANESGVGKRTIAYFEKGDGIAARTARDLQSALERWGVVFLEGDGGIIAISLEPFFPATTPGTVILSRITV